METTTSPYPLKVSGQLSPSLSRRVWLVKSLLAIPHFIALVFLWVAYVAVTVIASFAILFTGRYPRALFEFNVGVLRWTWHVGLYQLKRARHRRVPALHAQGHPRLSGPPRG